VRTADLDAVTGYKIGGKVYAPEDVTLVLPGPEAQQDGETVDDNQPVIWLVLQPGGSHATYTDEAHARGIAESTGSVLTHLPLDGDYRR